MSARKARVCRKCWQDQGCVSGELMGDLEKAEAGKGCKGRWIGWDKLSVQVSPPLKSLLKGAEGERWIRNILWLC